MAVNTFVVATNAIALAAGAPTPPYNPPWAIPLAAFGFAFIVPVAGIISQDNDERQTEQTAPQITSYDIGPNLAQAIPALVDMIKQVEGQKKAPDGPPAPTT